MHYAHHSLSHMQRHMKISLTLLMLMSETPAWTSP
nr:MAG TPA: hypothetical protein [Bacteriophage sp.]